MRKLLKKSAELSIRWKLAVYLALFLALVLVVTWIFQIYLLDTFYERIKEKEMARTGNTLSEYLRGDQVKLEELELISYQSAADGVMSVMICRVEEGEPKPLVNMDATGRNGVILPEDTLKDLLQRTIDHGGRYQGRFFGAQEVKGGRDTQIPRPNARYVRLMYLEHVESDTGDAYLILLNAGLQPLESTVEILKTQFFWITMILLLSAGTMVLLLYRHISAPLIAMNESAKQLARGKYDVEFTEAGYRETRELARTLNYAQKELSRVDHLQKELIANISHDLRTPLTMIKGYSEVMRDIPGENTPENMQVVIDETTRLSELVGDLLDLSRVQSGSRNPVFEVFDLTRAIEETLSRYEAFVSHKGYKITFLNDTHVFVSADRNMILQVLYNLINNAINYTGTDLSVEVKQTVVKNRVRISISDTGEGIEKDQMPLIWDRYYKVDKVHRRATVGTGLGLSITKEILESHHAAYGVDSTVGKGSTFWFELTITPPDPAPIFTEED